MTKASITGMPSGTGVRADCIGSPLRGAPMTTRVLPMRAPGRAVAEVVLANQADDLDEVAVVRLDDVDHLSGGRSAGSCGR